MQEIHSLSQSPERRGTEFIGTGNALCDPVAKQTHVVNQQIRIQISRGVGKGVRVVIAGRQRWRVAPTAPYNAELRSSIGDGPGGNAAVRTDRGGRSEEPHEICKSNRVARNLLRLRQIVMSVVLPRRHSA